MRKNRMQSTTILAFFIAVTSFSCAESFDTSDSSFDKNEQNNISETKNEKNENPDQDVPESPRENCKTVVNTPCGACNLGVTVCDADGVTPKCDLPTPLQNIKCNDVIYLSTKEEVKSANFKEVGKPQSFQSFKDALAAAKEGQVILISALNPVGSEPLVLDKPVTLVGGIEVAEGKLHIGDVPSTLNIVSPEKGDVVGVTVRDVSSMMKFYNLVMNVATPKESGKSCIGIRFVNSSQISMEDVSVNVSNGSDGASGRVGPRGATAEGRQNPSCSDSYGGKGGPASQIIRHIEDPWSSCNYYLCSYDKRRYHIIDRDQSIYELIRFYNHSDKEPTDGDNGGNNGGTGGEAQKSFGVRTEEMNGKDAKMLTSQPDRDAKFPSTADGRFDEAGVWNFLEPPTDGQKGADGAGGGGGGGSKPSSKEDLDAGLYGADGGDGGAGGCGGQGGFAGQSGGASVGVQLLNSQVAFRNVHVVAGQGGNGGNGGAGGAGGSGASGDKGHFPDKHPSDGARSGDGGDGSSGLRGGSGAPGLGGPSIAIYCDDQSSLNKSEDGSTFIAAAEHSKSGHMSSDQALKNELSLPGIVATSRGCLGKLNTDSAIKTKTE